MYRERIGEFVASHLDDMIADLAAFIAIPSESENRAEVGRALAFILNLARDMGFAARSELDGRVGVIECGDGPETLGILAHVDVVPAGERALWHTDPYRAEIRDGRLFGRGAIDDKGPVVSCLYAMKAVRELGLPFYKKVQMILGTQEEVVWTDMDAYVSAYPLPDYGFTPDDAFPICNIEKGCGAVELKIPFDLPAGGVFLASVAAGEAPNAVPASSRAVLSDGRVLRTEGRATHASQPEKGVNALVRMAELLRGMRGAGEIQPNAALDFMCMLATRFRSVYGEGIGLYSESEYYEGEFVHRNTVTPTFARTEGGVLTVCFDVRFPYGTAREDLTGAFERLAREFGGTSRARDLLPAVFVHSGRPFLRAFADAYEAMTPFKNEFTLAYGGSYAKAMPNVVAWGPLFPGDEDTCHEANEHIRLDALRDCASVYAQAIAAIALSPESFK